MQISPRFVRLLLVAMAVWFNTSSQFSQGEVAKSGTDSVYQMAELTASDASYGDLFGVAVAADANTAAVGAPYINSGEGAVYVYVKPPTGWRNMTETAKLTASDAASYNYFGWSVAISGDIIVVGAVWGTVGSNLQQGATYVFVRPKNGWHNMTETAKLTASDGAARDNLGWSVAIQGDTVVAGAVSANIEGKNQYQGAVYVFVKPAGGWKGMTQTAKLNASAPMKFDELGTAVSIDTNTIMATAIGDYTVGPGKAYIFVEPPNGWSNMTETAELTATDTGAQDFFGVSGGISGDTVAIGAMNGPNNSGVGIVYAFVKPAGGWGNMTQTAELTVSGFKTANLGVSVAISGTTVLAGASAVRNDRGAAFVFMEPSGGWTGGNPNLSLAASNGAKGDDFGACVSISGSTAVVGATQHSVVGLGKAYVFAP